MTAWRQAIELSIGDEDVARLVTITRSRTEPASRVERARMLLAYREDPSFFAVAHALGVHHQTVQRCVERALAYGPMAALDDRPRSGKEPTITAEAKAWLVSLACRKAKELGYPHELWTTRLLARHAREHGPAEGHGCLAKLVQGTVCRPRGGKDRVCWYVCPGKAIQTIAPSRDAPCRFATFNVDCCNRRGGCVFLRRKSSP
jgi:transposase